MKIYLSHHLFIPPVDAGVRHVLLDKYSGNLETTEIIDQPNPLRCPLSKESKALKHRIYFVLPKVFELHHCSSLEVSR